jgi:hypothetical protein
MTRWSRRASTKGLSGSCPAPRTPGAATHPPRSAARPAGDARCASGRHRSSAISTGSTRKARSPFSIARRGKMAGQPGFLEARCCAGAQGRSTDRRYATATISTWVQPSVLPGLRWALDHGRGTRRAAPLHVAIVEHEKADVSSAARGAAGGLGNLGCVAQGPRTHVAGGRGRRTIARSGSAHGSTLSLVTAYNAAGAQGLEPVGPTAGRSARDRPPDARCASHPRTERSVRCEAGGGDTDDRRDSSAPAMASRRRGCHLGTMFGSRAQ